MPRNRTNRGNRMITSSLPTLSTRTKYIIVGVGFIVCFATGRFSVNKPKIKTTIQTTQQDTTTEAKDTHTKTTITETKQPNGVDTKTTVIDQVQNDNTKSQDNITQQVQQTITPPKKNTLNISVLGANDFKQGILAPTYGLSVTKEVLGPITVGAFGLMNGTVGLSIGLNF